MSNPRKKQIMARVGAMAVMAKEDDLSLVRRMVTHLRSQGAEQLSVPARQRLVARGAGISSVLEVAIIELADKLGVK